MLPDIATFLINFISADLQRITMDQLIFDPPQSQPIDQMAFVTVINFFHFALSTPILQILYSNLYQKKIDTISILCYIH